MLYQFMLYIYIYKTKIRTYGDNVYINVRDSNVPEDGVKWNLLLISIFESFVSHFYWFITCLSQQILTVSIFRQLCLQNCRQGNGSFY